MILHPPSNAWMDGVLQPPGALPPGFFYSQFMRQEKFGEAIVKRCAHCQGKLGLGVRFRNLWNGSWWHHLRFCSRRCEDSFSISPRRTPPWHAQHTVFSKGIGEEPGIQTGVMPVEHVSGARLRLMGRSPHRSIHGKISIDASSRGEGVPPQTTGASGGTVRRRSPMRAVIGRLLRSGNPRRLNRRGKGVSIFSKHGLALLTGEPARNDTKLGQPLRHFERLR